MSLKGKMLLGAGLVLLLIVAGLFYLGSRIDSIVQAAIENYGSEITGTRVSVGSVDISLREGRGTLRDLRVANPDGFTDNDAMSFGEITLALNLDSLRGGGPIVIDEATIRDPHINYESSESGKGNLEAIQANIDRYRGPGSTDSGAAESGESPRIRIKQFTFENGSINISAPGLKEPIAAKLPSMHLSEVGGSEGATPPEIGKVIMADFTRAAGRTLAKEGLQRMLDKELGNGAGEKARGLIDSILK